MAGSNGAKKSRKHDRNYRARFTDHVSTMKETRYMTGRGPAKHEARTARNCGCNKPVNHSRKNRAEHARELALKALQIRRDSGLSTLPRGRRGPAQQPSRAAIEAALKAAAQKVA